MEIKTHEELTRTHASDSSEHETHEERTEGDCISRKAAIQAVTHFDDSLKRLYELPSVNPAKPCGDYISRQAVLNLFNKSDEYSWKTSWIRRKIEKMPSVEPERKVGKWIRFIEGDDIIHTGYMCSECKRTIKVFKGVKLKQFPYCHCGAKMVDEAESENKE